MPTTDIARVRGRYGTAVAHIGDTAMPSRVVGGTTQVPRDEPADREASLDPELEES